MGHQRILVWYRQDLRLHDHAPLSQAIESGAEIIPLYCFDPRQWAKTTPTSFGMPKMGGFRGQFLLESIADLQQNLQVIGSDLLLRQGHPETVLPQLCEILEINAVYYSDEVTQEETYVEKQLQLALATTGVKCQGIWDQTLYHRDDIPFAIDQLPELFTTFRKQVEKESSWRVPLAAPAKLPPLPSGVDRGQLPTLADLGITPISPDTRGVMPFQGGETAAIKRLDEYFWQRDQLRIYKQTRNGMLGADYSSKFSPWLALGCLSPRYIAQQIHQYETDRVANDSTYWLIFELLWRDYFRLIGAKHGEQLFKIGGLQNLMLPWKTDTQRFEQWKNGKTGLPLVDANMRELAATGFMSNRGRQNVASFLTKNLGIDWRWGAAYFESMLIDYDVCSNWGNWNYSAGIGNDARGFRCFSITKQAKDYDPQGEYVKYWCPELAQIPATKVQQPWQLSPIEQQQFAVQIGVDYPQPVVDLAKSAAANERIYNQATGDFPSNRSHGQSRKTRRSKGDRQSAK
ncbi:DASH family cryptochrome [filamentous cyanobacterium LEGE 11480]|uniref:Cryptochrome DASH n=1 Tax=Romeriopsis navalis LEGE 11480 TaxID=2777977 RepID=A0A928VT00_9CYAN|nr:DASH family cryptochrome [Romeriopsis navalis]MBE9033173.1 DASH family cryptochrome [Romeriopsis navalis LEGE 11480]